MKLFDLKPRHYMGMGFVLGIVAWVAVQLYGSMIVSDVFGEFKAAIKSNTQSAIFQAQGSDSQIAVYWNEPEKIPYDKAITVRVGDDKKKKIRTIIFQRQ
jgi:hypothetical protein